MRRLLLAAIVLVSLATGLLVWRIQGTGPGDATAVVVPPNPPAPRPEPSLAPQQRTPTERGRRAPAAEVGAPADLTNRQDAPSVIRILLLDPKGDPWPGVGLRVLSRSEDGEFDLYATTDRAGMIATDIDDPRQIELIGLDEGPDGLYAEGPFESAPDRPQVVVVKAPRTAQVAGIVRDEEGRPIPRARVEMEPEPVLGLDPFVGSFHAWKSEVDADADGRFALEISEGCFAFTPDMDGFDPGEIAFACLSADAPTVVDLTLQGASRELQVEVHSGGKPLGASVLVTATRAPAPAPRDRVLRDPLSIQRGGERRGASTYAVAISRDGDWSLVVSLAKGFADATVPVGPNDQRIVVDLRPPEREAHIVWARGTVSSNGGTPLPAEIAVFHGSDLEWASVGRTDVAGRFEIDLDSRETDPVFILAREPGFGSAGVGPIDLDRLPTSIDLVLRPERIISGIVVGPDGAELATRVSIHPSSGIFAPLSPAATPAPERFLDMIEPVLGSDGEAREDGSFVFRDLSEGWYEIWARAQDESLGLPPACVVAKAGERNLRIVLGSGLERFVALSGVIREAGTARPVAGARVAAGLARGGVWRSADVFSGEDGSYSIPGCPTEALLLYVDAPEHAIFASQIGPFSPGTREMDVDLPPARTLRLLALDSSGAPFSGLFVSAADAHGKPIALRDAAGHSADEDPMLTDLAGRADLHGLPAAAVVVVVGRRADDGRVVTNAAYQAPNAAQPERKEFRFDLRVSVDPVQRIVLPR